MAGGHDSSDEIADALVNIQADIELYRTRGIRDATRHVAERLRQADSEPLRFYACGGDGTLNEVVSGVMAASDGEQRVRNVEVACYPCGSGDDFVRYWQGADFRDIEALVTGTAVPVDVMQLGDRYCVNTLNFGFEAAVCHTMARVRRVPLIGGAMAYTTGIVASLATGRHNRCRVTVDGEVWLDGEVLLLSASMPAAATTALHAPRTTTGCSR